MLFNESSEHLMTDNKIKATDNIFSFHKLHTVRFPSHGGDAKRLNIEVLQKVNGSHQIEKQANNKDNPGNDNISVLYFNDLTKKSVKSFFADNTKSKSVPSVPLDKNKMAKTRKHRNRSHSVQPHNISLTSRIYSNYVHKTLSWLNILGNGDTKPVKLIKNRKKSKYDNAKSNPAKTEKVCNQKESYNPPLNKNKKYKVVETNDCNVKVLYKNKRQPYQLAISSFADIDKYAKKQTKLKKHSTDTNYVEADNNVYHISNVSKECAETDNRNEHKPDDTKTNKKQDRNEGNITKHAKRHSDHKKVKSNINEFTSELKEYFQIDQIGNYISLNENSLHPIKSENNSNKMKKEKNIKHHVRKSHQRNKKLRPCNSTPFRNEKIVEFSHQEMNRPSRKCFLKKSKTCNLKRNSSVLSIHGCKTIYMPGSQTSLYPYQHYPTVKTSCHKRCNKRNSKLCNNKTPCIEYKPIDTANYHSKDKVADYFKKLENCGDIPEKRSCKRTKAKTWGCNFLSFLQRRPFCHKTRVVRCRTVNDKYTDRPAISSLELDKNCINERRCFRKAQRVEVLDKAVDYSTEDRVADYYKKLRNCADIPQKHSCEGNKVKTWCCNFLSFLQRDLSHPKPTFVRICTNDKYMDAPDCLKDNEKYIYIQRSSKKAQIVNNNCDKHGRVMYMPCESDIRFINKQRSCRKAQLCEDSSVICSAVDPRYNPNIPIHRRFFNLLFDVTPPKCETCSFNFNRKPLLTEIFMFSPTQNRNSSWEILRKYALFTISSLLVLPFLLLCRCLKCTTF